MDGHRLTVTDIHQIRKYLCLSVRVSRLNHYTGSNRICHENTLIIKQENKLIFTANTDIYPGGAAGKS